MGLPYDAERVGLGGGIFFVCHKIWKVFAGSQEQPAPACSLKIYNS